MGPLPVAEYCAAKPTKATMARRPLVISFCLYLCARRGKGGGGSTIGSKQYLNLKALRQNKKTPKAATPGCPCRASALASLGEQLGVVAQAHEVKVLAAGVLCVLCVWVGWVGGRVDV